MPCLHQVGAKSFCIFTFTCNQLIFVLIAQGKEKEKIVIGIVKLLTTVCFVLIYFHAAQKMQKEVVKLLIGLDSSLTKVKDKNGRIPTDVVPSNELEMLNLLQHKHK